MNIIEKNYEDYVNLLLSTKRDGIMDLVGFIRDSDFKTAPASTNYHNAKEGGLCKHSLNVYQNLVKLNDTFEAGIPDDTIKIVSLLHDISKVNFYKEYSQNKKVYDLAGSKRDELGSFDWVSVKGYKIKDSMERDLIIGDHGVNSFYIVNKYIKLSDGEASAIINHHAGMDNNFMLRDLNEVFHRYPTAMLLHLADMSACYINENPYMVEDE